MSSFLINLDKPVPNTEHAFGEAQEYYFTEVLVNGRLVPAFLTEHAIKEAMDRAARNKEDVPHKSFLKRVWHWLIV